MLNNSKTIQGLTKLIIYPSSECKSSQINMFPEPIKGDSNFLTQVTLSQNPTFHPGFRKRHQKRTHKKPFFNFQFQNRSFLISTLCWIKNLYILFARILLLHDSPIFPTHTTCCFWRALPLDLSLCSAPLDLIPRENKTNYDVYLFIYTLCYIELVCNHSDEILRFTPLPL